MNTQKNHLIWCIVIYSLLQQSVASNEYPPPCSSEIYCHGRLLHTIQMTKIYRDSKTFVDMRMRYGPKSTLEKFDELMLHNNNTPNASTVKRFIETMFAPGEEFEPWEPQDWIETPRVFLDSIQDTQLREYGRDLHAIWKTLGRQIKDQVKHNQDHYSIIWVPNPVIVPGGRFREFYYWDSYWIIQGLLLSEMYTTARGMLENFLFIVKKYGHVPNGGRVYYAERSQPPLLIPMIKLYVDHLMDYEFVAANIEAMEMEFDYWMTNHTKTVTVDNKNYTLCVYIDRSDGPRPESYSEDIESAKDFPDEARRRKYYSELKAAAESGWDFSSRWFINNSTNKGNLTHIEASSIVPVDLNAVIYWNAVILAEFNQLLNKTAQVKKYMDLANQWLEAVNAVLWHEEVGAWLDFDLINHIKRDFFYPTNLAPLWTNCYAKERTADIVRLNLKYLQKMKVMYPGGIPTTKEHTGEQWDFPNAWPPLQHMLVVGLNNTGNEAAGRLAFELAQRWVASNYEGFRVSQSMYEKYDATVPGERGGGGEYDVQKGFGWSNGVVMDLLFRYGDALKPPRKKQEDAAQTTTVVAAAPMGQVTTGLIALMVSLVTGFIG